jgi:hypothetical protein
MRSNTLNYQFFKNNADALSGVKCPVVYVVVALAGLLFLVEPADQGQSVVRLR